MRESLESLIAAVEFLTKPPDEGVLLNAVWQPLGRRDSCKQ